MGQFLGQDAPTGIVQWNGEIPPAPPLDFTITPAPGPPSPLSWFEQSTIIFGAEVPNLALAAGGGLLLLSVIIKRKR